MQIFINTDSHEIRVVRTQPGGGDGGNGRLNISPDQSNQTDGHTVAADENNECLEEMDSDSSAGVMALGSGGGEGRRSSEEEEEEEGEDQGELLPTLRFLARLLGGTV